MGFSFKRAGRIALGIATLGASESIRFGLRLIAPPPLPATPAQQRKISKVGTDQPIPVVYGKAQIGGHIIFDEIDGADRWVVLALCEGQIEAVDEILLDDKPLESYGAGQLNRLELTSPPNVGDAITWTLDGTPYSYTAQSGETSQQILSGLRDAVLADDRWIESGSSIGQNRLQVSDTLTSTYTPTVTMPSGSATASVPFAAVPLATASIHLGLPTETADAGLMAAFPAKWTAAHRGDNVAYVVIKMTADDNSFGARPLFKFAVRGKLLLDTRTSLTAYSTNRALAVYQFATENNVYGESIDPADIDLASVSAAANDCDTQLETFVGSGVFINQCEANGAIDTADDPTDNLKLLLGTRLKFRLIGGKWVMGFRKASASVLSLVEGDNILGEISWQSADKGDLANRVTAKFTNPDTRWETDERTVESATFLTADGGELLEVQIDLPLEIDPVRAEYEADVGLKTSRLSPVVKLRAKMRAYELTPGDVVDLTYASAGWVAKLFTVVEIVSDPKQSKSGPVALTLVPYDPTVWDRTVPASAYVPPASTGLVDPTTVIAPTDVAVASAGHSLTLGSGDVLVRALVSWVATADPYVSRYEIEGMAVGGAWGDAPLVTVDKTATQVFMNGLKDLTAYLFRVRAINSQGYKSQWAELVSAHTVIGNTTAPPTPTGLAVATPSDGIRHISWNFTPQPDLSGFRVEYQDNGGGWVDLFGGLIRPSSGSTHGAGFNTLAAGVNYDFRVTPVTTSGVDSVSPATITSQTLPAPIHSGNFLTLFDHIDARTIVAGVLKGRSIQTDGSHLTVATLASATTVNVRDTTGFPASGTGLIFTTSIDPSPFAWTGKTATTLTGCTGVVAAPADALVMGSAGAVMSALGNTIQYVDFPADDPTNLRVIATIGGSSDGTLFINGSVNATTPGIRVIGVDMAAFLRGEKEGPIIQVGDQSAGAKHHMWLQPTNEAGVPAGIGFSGQIFVDSAGRQFYNQNTEWAQINPSARVKFQGRATNGACTIDKSTNVSGVDRVALGIYRINFANALADAHYMLDPNASNSGALTPHASEYSLTYGGRTTTQAVVRFSQNSAGVDPLFATINVEGS